ncbi:MAG: glycosyltransferase, partial [Solirubrobacteraceae bacterium]
MADETPGLAVGIVEPGRENSGIRRYGEVLAAGLRGIPGVEVTELSVALTSPGWRGIRDAGRLVRALGHVDVAVVPYTRWNIWSPSVTRLVQLALVHLGLRRRTLTVLHDVNHPGSLRRREWWALALTVRRSGATVIHSEHERTELGAIPGAQGVELIHHFVVERQGRARVAARAELGVGDSKVVVGMIGWINPRKNCELAIEALALSEPGVELWLVGGAGIGQEAYVESLRALAHDLGVDDRLVITGTVPEAELEQRLAALDVGLCPYRRISASGSLSTLLGAH